VMCQDIPDMCVGTSETEVAGHRRRVQACVIGW
jgi:hypothetical protein